MTFIDAFNRWIDKQNRIRAAKAKAAKARKATK